MNFLAGGFNLLIHLNGKLIFFFPPKRSHLHIKNGKSYFKERLANKMKVISLRYALSFRIENNFH